MLLNEAAPLPAGQYLMQGGAELQVARVIGNFRQDGGTLKLGDQFAQTAIEGSYQLGANAVLELVLPAADKVAGSLLKVTGDLDVLGGSLQISDPGQRLATGAVWTLMDVQGRSSGQFKGLAEGGTVAGGARISYRGGADARNLVLFKTEAAQAVHLNQAGRNDVAYVIAADTKWQPVGSQAYKGLEVLAGGHYVLDPSSRLDLDGGKGTLTVHQGGIFSGNGLINGHIRNGGLVRIPIVALSQVTGGYVQAQTPPLADIKAPVAVNTGTYVALVQGGGASGGGGGGAPAGCVLRWWDCGSTPPSTPPVATPIVLKNEAPVVVKGTFAFDASLEVTGNYRQEDSGALRLFLGGDQPGITYSQLLVGQQVDLSGAVQVVLLGELFKDFKYTPHIGDSFDFVKASGGISLSPTLKYEFFVTKAGKHLFPQFGSLTAYNSGISGDPDRLYRVNQTLFSFQLAEDGKLLRGTLTAAIAPVPEPGSYLMLGGGLLALQLLMRRRRKSAAEKGGESVAA